MFILQLIVTVVKLINNINIINIQNTLYFFIQLKIDQTFHNCIYKFKQLII